MSCGTGTDGWELLKGTRKLAADLTRLTWSDATGYAVDHHGHRLRTDSASPPDVRLGFALPEAWDVEAPGIMRSSVSLKRQT
jgi:hypothetical protein